MGPRGQAVGRQAGVRSSTNPVTGRTQAGLSLWQKGLWRAKTYSGFFAIRSRGQHRKAHWGQA